MQLSKKRGLYESGRIVYLPTDMISANPDQPRRIFEPTAMRDLASSISRYGVLQPLNVRRRDGGYELVSGERRLRAARLAGLQTVPCIVLEVTSRESSVLALVENLQRRDLDFLEQAEGLNKLVALYGLSQEEAARRVGLSQSAVANKLRILKLPQELLYIIREANMTERHARALLRLESERDMAYILEQVIRGGLTVARTEELIDDFLAAKDKPEKSSQQNEQRPTYVIKDVRLFLNTIARGMDMMHQSGIMAEYGKAETDTDIVLTIKIPKSAPAKG